MFWFEAELAVSQALTFPAGPSSTSFCKLATPSAESILYNTKSNGLPWSVTNSSSALKIWRVGSSESTWLKFAMSIPA